MSNFTAQPVAFGSKAAPDAQVQIAPHQPDVVGLRIDPTRKGTQAADLMKVFSLLGEEIFTIEPDGTTLIKDLIVTGSMSAETSATSLDVTTLNVLGTAYFSDGTSAVPSIAFESDSDTGIFRQGSGIIVMTVNGASGMTLNASKNMVVAGSVTCNSLGATHNVAGEYLYASSAGTSALPAIGFNSDTDNGIFNPAANTLAIATNGASAVAIGSTGNVYIAGDLYIGDEVFPSGEIYAPDGAYLAPAYSFASDPDIGMCRLGADILAFATSGLSAITIDANRNVWLGATLTVPGGYIKVPDGTASLPTYTFDNDTDVGMYCGQAEDTLVFATSGLSAMSINAYQTVDVASGLNCYGSLWILPTALLTAPSGDMMNGQPGINSNLDGETGIAFSTLGGTDHVVGLTSYGSVRLSASDNGVGISGELNVRGDIYHNGFPGRTANFSGSVVHVGEFFSNSIERLGSGGPLLSGDITPQAPPGGLLAVTERFMMNAVTDGTTDSMMFIGAPSASAGLPLNSTEYCLYEANVVGVTRGGAIFNCELVNGGMDWAVGDTAYIRSACSPSDLLDPGDQGYDAIITVTAVDLTTSAATGISLDAPGSWYTWQNPASVSAVTPSVGNNLTVNISAYGDYFSTGEQCMAAYKLTCVSIQATVLACSTTVLYDNSHSWNAYFRPDDLITGMGPMLGVSGGIGESVYWTATVQVTKLYQ